MVDIGDPTQVKARNLEIKQHGSILKATIHAIMSQPNGRAFIYWLLGLCNMHSNPFATNALIMAHRSGEMNIGLQLLAEITTRENIDLYCQMLKEGTNSDARDERRDNADAA